MGTRATLPTSRANRTIADSLKGGGENNMGMANELRETVNETHVRRFGSLPNPTRTSRQLVKSNLLPTMSDAVAPAKVSVRWLNLRADSCSKAQAAKALDPTNQCALELGTESGLTVSAVTKHLR